MSEGGGGPAALAVATTRLFDGPCLCLIFNLLGYATEIMACRKVSKIWNIKSRDPLAWKDSVYALPKKRSGYQYNVNEFFTRFVSLKDTTQLLQDLSRIRRFEGDISKLPSLCLWFQALSPAFKARGFSNCTGIDFSKFDDRYQEFNQHLFSLLQWFPNLSHIDFEDSGADKDIPKQNTMVCVHLINNFCKNLQCISNLFLLKDENAVSLLLNAPKLTVKELVNFPCSFFVKEQGASGSPSATFAACFPNLETLSLKTVYSESEALGSSQLLVTELQNVFRLCPKLTCVTLPQLSIQWLCKSWEILAHAFFGLNGEQTDSSYDVKVAKSDDFCLVKTEHERTVFVIPKRQSRFLEQFANVCLNTDRDYFYTGHWDEREYSKCSCFALASEFQSDWTVEKLRSFECSFETYLAPFLKIQINLGSHVCPYFSSQQIAQIAGDAIHLPIDLDFYICGVPQLNENETKRDTNDNYLDPESSRDNPKKLKMARPGLLPLDPDTLQSSKLINPMDYVLRQLPFQFCLSGRGHPQPQQSQSVVLPISSLDFDHLFLPSVFYPGLSQLMSLVFVLQPKVSGLPEPVRKLFGLELKFYITMELLDKDTE